MNGLTDKIAFVTGGGSGIGRETCLRLAREGARVAVVDLRPEAAAAVAEEVLSAGGQGLAVTCDVTKSADVQRGVAGVVEPVGGLEFVVNCAGIALGEGGVVECDEGAWNKTLAVNVTSIFLTGKYAIPELLKRGGGSIVNIASVFGMVANPDECAYAATKGAVINLTRQMAVQHARDGIRVNAVLPSDCDTPLIAGLLGVEGDELEAAKKELAAPIPAGRLAKPTEIAAGIAFLLSEDSVFITGVALPIDGGFLCR